MKQILILISIWLLMMSISFEAVGSDTAKVETMEPERSVRHVLYIESAAQGGSAELRVNDLPAGMVHGDGKLFSKNIEALLLPGKNTLSIRPTDQSGTIQSRIVAYRLDEFVDGRGGQTFLYLQSENGERKSAEGTLSKQREMWSWCGNDQLSEQDQSDALQTVKKIYKALEDGDSQSLTGYLEPVFSDLSKISPGIDKGDYVKDLTERIARLKTSEIWEFKNLDELQVVLVPVADSRLLDVRRGDGTPLFRTDQNSPTEWFSIWSMIGRQNGEWKIYR